MSDDAIIRAAKALGARPSVIPDVQAYMHEEWRRVSIPDWRRILRESIEQGDKKREEYARWMLREILLDPGYTE